MSASRADLVEMFQEADRRGDRTTAEAVMLKLEQMQQPTVTAQPQPTPQAQPTPTQEPAVIPEQTGTGLGMAFGGKKEDLDFTERVGLDLEKRKQEVTESLEDLLSGKIRSTEAAVQVVGKGFAGSLFDVMGEGVTEGVKAVERMAPETTESIKEGWRYLSETETGKQIGEVLEGGITEYRKFKEANPRAAKDIESVLNIGMLIAPVKVKAKIGPTPLGKTAAALEASAGRSARKNKQVFVDELISPEKTKKVLQAETARTTEKGVGPFKRSVVELSSHEKAIAKEVNQISGVSNKKTIQGNLNVISKANKNLAVKLDKKLKNAQKPVTRKEVNRNIDNAIELMIKENPVIVGNAETTARRVADKAKIILDDHPGTPKGIWDARKELDAWIKSQKGDKAFDPVMENSLSIAVREVRTSMNHTVAKHAPSVTFEKDMKRMGKLYDAIENIAPKAAKEPNTAILRAWQNAAIATRLKGRANQELALMLGMGTLGAMAAFAPYITAGFATILGGRSIKNLVMAPGSRKGAAKLIKMVDRAILSSKNPSMIKQLRADRMVLVDFLKSEEETP